MADYIVLDRDGVINSTEKKNGYIGLVKDFKWIKGSKRTIKFLKSKNYKVVIVTNQSGIARGYFSIKDTYKVHNYIKEELKKIGIFHSTIEIENGREKCSDQ